MTSYNVNRTIDAPPDVIWSLLTDASNYSNWNRAVVSIDGTISPDEKIKLISIVNPKRAFSLTVSEFDPPRRMVWSDGMPLGLFKGVRTFTVTPTDAGTEFSMREVYSGFLAPLITKTIPDMTDSFNQFADGLKLAAESAGS